jgi:hypothetical protein
MSSRRINSISDDSSSYDSGEESVTEIQPAETFNETVTNVRKEETKRRSWVYEFSEKLKSNGKTYFHCRCEFKNGRKCTYKVLTKNGQTTGIAYHLREKHDLKPPSKLVQSTLNFENMPPVQKAKTFREEFAELIAKQYLTFSLIEEKVLQDAFIAFHNEWVKNKSQPVFVTDKTVAADIAKMADTYIAEMKVK